MNSRRDAIRAKADLRRCHRRRRATERKLDALRDAIERLLCDMDDMTRGQARARLLSAYEAAGISRDVPYDDE